MKVHFDDKKHESQKTRVYRIELSKAPPAQGSKEFFKYAKQAFFKYEKDTIVKI